MVSEMHTMSEADARLDARLQTLKATYERIVGDTMLTAVHLITGEDYSVATCEKPVVITPLYALAKERQFTLFTDFAEVVYHFAKTKGTIPLVGVLGSTYPAIAGLCEFVSKTLYVDHAMPPLKTALTFIHESTHLLCEKLTSLDNQRPSFMEAIAYMGCFLVGEELGVEDLITPTIVGMLHYNVSMAEFEEAMPIAKEKALFLLSRLQ